MSAQHPPEVWESLTADQLVALVAAGEVVLTHRWLLDLTVPIGEVQLRQAVQKLELLLHAAVITSAREARRRANGGGE